MKPITLQNITESLLHPAGRFATLEGIELLRDEKENPLSRFFPDRAEFVVERFGRRWTLTCPLILRQEETLEIRPDPAALREMRRKELVECRFHLREMLVFDGKDRPVMLDVWVTELPEGMSMARYLEFAVIRKDRYALFDLFRRLSLLASELIGERPYSHGNLSADTIFITPDGSLRLTDYRRLLTPDDREWNPTENPDKVPLLIWTLFTGCLAAAGKPWCAIAGTTTEEIGRALSDFIFSRPASDFPPLFHTLFAELSNAGRSGSSLEVRGSIAEILSRPDAFLPENLIGNPEQD